MSADVTTLGIGVDATAVDRATDALNRLADAADNAAGGATKTEKSMAGGMLSALQLDRAISAVVGTLTSAIKGFVDLSFGIGKYQDIAEYTMSDPAGLARLDLYAKVAGVSIETVAGAMNRMAQRIAKVDDDSKGAGKALAAIGIEVTAFKNLKPEEQYETVSVALGKYADSQDKVNVATAIFGLGGAQQLRVMKEMAEAGDVNNLITNEMIKRADDLGDSQTRMRVRMQQYIAVIGAEGLLPVIQVATEEFVKLGKAMFDIDDGAQGIVKTQELIRGWGESIVLTFAGVIDFVRTTKQEFESIVGVVNAVLEPLRKFNELRNERFREAGWLADKPPAFVGPTEEAPKYAAGSAQEQMAKAFAAQRVKAEEDRRAGAYGGMWKGKEDNALDFKDTTADKKTKELDVYGQLIGRIKDKIAAEQLELESGEKLTGAQKYRLSIEEAIGKSKQQFTVAQLVEIDMQARVVEARMEEVDALKAARKAQEDAIVAREKETDAVNKQADAQEASARRAERELANFGKSKDELEELEIVRLRTLANDRFLAASQADLARETDDGAGSSTRMAAALNAEAEAAARTANQLGMLLQKRRDEEIKGREKAVRIEITTGESAIADQYQRNAEAAEYALQVYGRTDEELAQLEVREIRRAALIARSKQEEIERTEQGTTPASAAFQAQADALTRAADAQERLTKMVTEDKASPMVGAKAAVTDYLKGVGEAAANTKQFVNGAIGGLENVLTNAFTGKPSGAKEYVTGIINEFMRLAVVKPMLASIMGGAQQGGGGSKGVFGELGGWIGAIGGLFGAGSGGGGGGASTDFGGMSAGAIMGGAASGGDTDAFATRQVNERGPELLSTGGKDFLMMGSKGGKVTPNESLGGKQIVINNSPVINIDSRSDQAQIAKMVGDANDRSQRQMMEQLKAQGVF